MRNVLEQDTDTQDAVEELNEIEFFGERAMRWYQVAARNQVATAFEQDWTRVLVVLPTGAGKTLTNGSILLCPRVAKKLAVPNHPLRVLFIAHKHRLLSQAERAYADESGILTVDSSNLNDTWMGGNQNAKSPVEIYYHSAFSDLPNIEYDLVVIDEAHHEAMMTIQYHLEVMGNKPILGLTATQDRADGSLIKFEVIVEPISREEAVEQGYLSPTFLYSFVDAPEKDKTGIVRDILDSYASQMGQTMVFMRTKAEARVVANHIESLGYTVALLLDQTERQLDNMLEAFSRGEYQFIVNCNKINEGVDVKNCQSVLLGRTYGSYPQLNQVIGRAARPDSECRVFEIINPLSGTNLDTTVVVGTPEQHKLIYSRNNQWIELDFDYVHTTSLALEPERISFGGRR